MSTQKIVNLKNKLNTLEKNELLQISSQIERIKKERIKIKIKNIEKLLEIITEKDENSLKEVEEILLKFLKEKNML